MRYSSANMLLQCFVKQANLVTFCGARFECRFCESARWLLQKYIHFYDILVTIGIAHKRKLEMPQKKSERERRVLCMPKNMLYTSQNAQIALDAAWMHQDAQQKIKWKAILLQTKVPRTSLMRWMALGLRKYEQVPASGAPTLFTAQQELMLAESVKAKNLAGLGLPNDDLLRTGAKLAVSLGKSKQGNQDFMSQDWARALKKRSGGALSLRRGKPLEAERAAVTVEQVAKFCDQLEELRGTNNFSEIWNMDEWGIGGTLKRVPLTWHHRDVEAHEDATIAMPTEHITFVSAISDKGRTMTPIVILKGMTVQVHMLEQCPDWQFTATQKGWTNATIFNQWWKNFLAYIGPYTAERGMHLLLLDQHGSHFSENMRHAATEHGVHVMFFPPHATHFLQPLDVGVIGNTKLAITKAVREWRSKRTRGFKLRTADIPGIVKGAIRDKFDDKNIKAAFKHANLSPYNREKILNNPKLQAGAVHGKNADIIPNPAPAQIVAVPAVPDAVLGTLYQLGSKTLLKLIQLTMYLQIRHPPLIRLMKFSSFANEWRGWRKRQSKRSCNCSSSVRTLEI